MRKDDDAILLQGFVRASVSRGKPLKRFFLARHLTDCRQTVYLGHDTERRQHERDSNENRRSAAPGWRVV
jgi:hypothetical protein